MGGEYGQGIWFVCDIFEEVEDDGQGREYREPDRDVQAVHFDEIW